jgi:hypothetical protein
MTSARVNPERTLHELDGRREQGRGSLISIYPAAPSDPKTPVRMLARRAHAWRRP